MMPKFYPFCPKNACIQFGLQKYPNLKFEFGNEKIFGMVKIAKIPNFSKIHQNSKLCKKWLRDRSILPGTVLESWRPILSQNQNCINKIKIFYCLLGTKKWVRGLEKTTQYFGYAKRKLQRSERLPPIKESENYFKHIRRKFRWSADSMRNIRTVGFV